MSRFNAHWRTTDKVVHATYAFTGDTLARTMCGSFVRVAGNRAHRRRHKHSGWLYGHAVALSVPLSCLVCMARTLAGVPGAL